MKEVKLMNKFLSLIKVQMKSQWGLSLARYTMKNDKKALLKGIGFALIILISLGQFVFFYTFLLSKVYEASKAMNIQRLILTSGAMATGLFTLFFGILFILGALFLSKDIQLLSSLPLRQQSIFLSKFVIVLLEEYLFVLFFMVPPVIIYGAGEGMGVAYYLTALICILLLPLIPLVISALLSLGMMRLVSQSRRRDLITIIGSVVLLVALMVGQFALLSKIPEDDPNFLIQLLQDSEGILEFSGRMYPPAIWITRALSGTDSAVNLLYLIASSAIAFGLVYVLASLIYQKGAVAQLETRKRSGKTKLQYRASSQVMVIFKIEWRNLLRTPVYALNSLIIIIIGPLLMSMPLFGGNLTSDPDIEAIYLLLNNNDTQRYLPFVIAAIIAVMAIINPAVSSSFSREGESFRLLKTIPVAPYKQVFGKLLAGYSISLMAGITTAVMVTLSFKVRLEVILFSTLLGSISLIPANALGLLFDLIRPKLRWTNPQEAIKQNFNVILAMITGAVYMAIMGFITFFLFRAGINATIISLLILLILIVSAGASLLLLYRVSDRLFKRIEL